MPRKFEKLLKDSLKTYPEPRIIDPVVEEQDGINDSPRSQRELEGRGHDWRLVKVKIVQVLSLK